MKCPFCSCLEDRVIETRVVADGNSVRRRRVCLSCSYRFTSYEHIEEKVLMVKKHDGRREPFSIAKLTSGVEKAIQKRPISTSVIENMLHDIEEKSIFLAGDSREITSNQIGEMIMGHLYNIDKVAYIRFASVYRQFEDVNEFIKEIENIT